MDKKEQFKKFIECFELVTVSVQFTGDEIIATFQMPSMNNCKYEFTWCANQPKIKKIINSETGEEVNISMIVRELFDPMFRNEIWHWQMISYLRIYVENKIRENVIGKIITMLKNDVEVQFSDFEYNI